MSDPARAQNNGITVEAVSDYSLVCGSAGVCGNLLVANESNNFMNGMVSGGWVDNGRYYNDNVWDADMEDYEVSGDPNDDDNGSFDQYNGYNPYTGGGGNPTTTVLGLFAGHGTCDDLADSFPCNTSADCGGNGNYCPSAPPNALHGSKCVFNKPSNVYTSSTHDVHSHYAWYGSHSQGGYANARWGEDAFATWTGDTDGENNVVFLLTSCATRWPGFSEGQLGSATGGAGLVNALAPNSFLDHPSGTPPIYSDSYDWAGWGAILASRATNNPNEPIYISWRNTFYDHAPQVSNGGCPNTNNDYRYGGGHGLLGCGFIVSEGFDNNFPEGSCYKANMTWAQSQGESSLTEAQGPGYICLYWTGNYDYRTYGYTK
jgi:hypothetical protein